MFPQLVKRRITATTTTTRTSITPHRTVTTSTSFLLLLFQHLLLLHLLTSCHCLKLTSVEVPTMVPMGEPFWLNCSYELGNQGLYSIKWYHWNPESSVNGEFYRWVPNDNPPGQMFQLKGIHIDLQRSHYGNVRLISSDLYTDGSFRCEVSAEAPSFQTVRKEKELHVYSLPPEKPSIRGIGPDPSRYGPGDLINVSCHAKPSRPPTKLSWLINDEPALTSNSGRGGGGPVKLIAGPRRSDGLESSRADLQFYSERAHYRNGLLKLHCLSSIVQPYNVNSEEVVIGENAKYTNSPQLVTESMSKDVPIITGIKSTGYRVGDILNLTCISRAKTAPKLSFIVNDLPANASQIRSYPVHRLIGGLLASKLGLEFRVEAVDLPVPGTGNGVGGGGGGIGGSKLRQNVHYSSSFAAAKAAAAAAANSNAVRQYRIKCTASMEKTIYSEVTEVHLGTSKQSSGLHLAGSSAAAAGGGRSSHHQLTMMAAILLLHLAYFSSFANWIGAATSMLSSRISF